MFENPFIEVNKRNNMNLKQGIVEWTKHKPKFCWEKKVFAFSFWEESHKERWHLPWVWKDGSVVKSACGGP